MRTRTTLALLVSALVAAAATPATAARYPLPTMHKVAEGAPVASSGCPVPGRWQVARKHEAIFQCDYAHARAFFEDKSDYWLRRAGEPPRYGPAPHLHGGPPWIVKTRGAVVYSGGKAKARDVLKRQRLAYALDQYLIDRFPTSPLIGRSIVNVQEARRYDVDPRVETAIAVCETGAGTTGQGPAVHNPYGLFDAHSRNRRFSNWRKSAHYLSRLLRRSYLDRGLTDLAAIGAKYAPADAANDRLHHKNLHWYTCVNAVYRAVGGKRYLTHELSPWQKKQAIRAQISQLWQNIASRPELGHYSQARPIPNIARGLTVSDVLDGTEWWGDCSGTVVWIDYRAGLPMPPSGLYSWTGSMFNEFRHVYMPAVGDDVLYHDHVVAIIGFAGGKPTRDRSKIYVGSMGSEPGPYGNPKTELVASYRSDFRAFLRPPGL